MRGIAPPTAPRAARQAWLGSGERGGSVSRPHLRRNKTPGDETIFGCCRRFPETAARYLPATKTTGPKRSRQGTVMIKSFSIKAISAIAIAGYIAAALTV